MLAIVVGMCLVTTTCRRPPDALGRVDANHVLRVAAVRSSLPPDAAAEGITPVARVLISRFANDLDARVRVQIEPSQRAVRASVEAGTADLGLVRQRPGASIAGMHRTQAVGASRLVAVVGRGDDHPDELSDLSGRLVLSGESGLGDWLRKRHPRLEFRVEPDKTTSQIVTAVAHGTDEATLITRTRFRRYRRYFPQLHQAFRFSGARYKNYWLFNGHMGGDSAALYHKAVAFIARHEKSGQYKRLKARYEARGADLDYVGIRAFAEYFGSRLPEWQSDFEKAARHYGIDWRLLAAISYQESRWRQHAVSSTGVRGLMMLTSSTAKAVGVKDRRDPQQSIDGGAIYYKKMAHRLPVSIAPPDRKWFALAAYNVGFGHVMDARRLLKRRGQDPDLWVNLKQALLMLTKERYARHARNGQAKGKQAVAYVAHVRAYYDMLRWETRHSGGSSSQPWGEMAIASAQDNSASGATDPVAPIRSPMF